MDGQSDGYAFLVVRCKESIVSIRSSLDIFVERLLIDACVLQAQAMLPNRGPGWAGNNRMQDLLNWVRHKAHQQTTGKVNIDEDLHMVAAELEKLLNDDDEASADISSNTPSPERSGVKPSQS
jgi:hypothetical protein